MSLEDFDGLWGLLRMLFLFRKTYFFVEAGRRDTFNGAWPFRRIAVAVLVAIRVFDDSVYREDALS